MVNVFVFLKSSVFCGFVVTVIGLVHDGGLFMAFVNCYQHLEIFSEI